MTNSTDKSKIRELYKAQRSALPAAECREAGKRILKHILKFPTDLPLCLYSSIQNEVDLQDIQEWALKINRRIYYPRLKGQKMEFVQITSSDQLLPGKWTKEPNGDRLLDKDTRAIALIPGLAFTMDGHRLGFGRGYYDNFFCDFPALIRLGIAYDFQICLSAWVAEAHDQQMDYSLTPSSIWGGRGLLQQPLI